MTTDYNPYKIALTLLQKKLKEEDIPLISKKIDEKLISIPEEGFDVNKLKTFLHDYQKKGIVKQRTTKSYNAYEIIQCLRKSYYLRMGAPVNPATSGIYPFSTIKATVGGIVEKLILSFYNQAEGTKFRNDVDLKWDMDKEWGTLYPFYGVIDALSYDNTVLGDVKFTNVMDPLHLEQVLLYMCIFEAKEKAQTFKQAEIIYVNSDMNAITTKKYVIDDDMRKTKFLAIKDRILYYDHCLKEKALPQEEKKKCDFCPYELICGQTNFSTEVELNGKPNIQLPNSETQPKGDSLKENKGTELKIGNHTKKPDSNIKILL